MNENTETVELTCLDGTVTSVRRVMPSGTCAKCKSHYAIQMSAEIAEYYARCEREARSLATQLLEAMNARAPTAEIRRLERLLEEARNTGD